MNGVKKEALPDKEDFQGWTKHLAEQIYKKAGIQIEDGIPIDTLQRTRFKLFERLHRLNNKNRLWNTLEPWTDVEAMKQERRRRSSYWHRLAKEQVEEMKQWKRDVWRHFEISQELIKSYPKEEQAEATDELRAFGGLIATGRFPKNYSTLILVGQMLSIVLKGNKWPSRTEFYWWLRMCNIEVAKSTLAECLEGLGVSDFVRDTQKG